MESIPLLVFGASGHARVIIDMAERCGRFRILGLMDSFRPVGEILMGYPVLGDESVMPDYLLSHPRLQVHVAIGDNGIRERISHRLEALLPGMAFATIVHPAAIVSRDVTIGEGCCIMPGAVVNAGSRIGQGCIVNSNAILEHDGRMGDFSSLGSGAAAAGGVHLGRCVAVLAGAVLKHGISLGDHCVVQTGAVVTGSMGPGRILGGHPALVIGERLPGESYL